MPPSAVSANKTASWRREAIETTHEIISPPNQAVLDTRKIRRPPTTDQHDTVLLNVVAFARDDGRDLSPVGEPNTRRFALARVGLLGARDADSEAHALHLGAVGAGEDGGDGTSCLLALPAALETKTMVSCQINIYRGRNRKKPAPTFPNSN